MYNLLKMFYNNVVDMELPVHAGYIAIIQEVSMDWKRKLTSRKFWLSVASFVTMLLVYFGKSENEAAQIAALIMAGATVIGYVIGEGLADSSGNIPEDKSESEK